MSPAVSALPEILRPFATPSGAICTLALDHRDALRNSYRKVGQFDVTDEVMLALKARILGELASAASAVLLDDDALRHTAPRDLGILMPLEAQGHETVAGGRRTHPLANFGPGVAAARGAHGCKLLLYYRDDHRETAPYQLELAVTLAEQCHDHGLAFVVEPKVYALQGEDKKVFAHARGDHIVKAAAALAQSGADLLKLQYPGGLAACLRVSEAAGAVPWTLLGGPEIDGGVFAEYVDVAGSAGARGYIAGRPIWGGVITVGPTDQQRWLRHHARPLLTRLTEIADTHARSNSWPTSPRP